MLFSPGRVRPRVDNPRRVADVILLMVDAALIVIVSFIGPFRSERGYARGLFAPRDFKEVLVDASLEACAERAPKGLYAKALAGEIRNLTGFGSHCKRPERPDLRLDTERLAPDECVDLLAERLDRGLPAPTTTESPMTEDR